MGISYHKFRMLFNRKTSTTKIRVFIHNPDSKEPVLTFLNESEAYDNYEISHVEFSVVRDDDYVPMIQADVWIT